MYDARYAKDWNKLYLCNDILYRKGTVSNQVFQQLVVQLSYRDEIFKALPLISAIKDAIGPPLSLNRGSTGQESTHSSVTEFDGVNAAY